jgi:hypothetical protein
MDTERRFINHLLTLSGHGPNRRMFGHDRQP